MGFRLSIKPGGRILDLGCGTGDIAIWLATQGYEAHGIDIAPSAIAWATEKAQAQATRVQFTTGSVLDLTPYKDDFFRLVVDGRCLHCIIGPDRAATPVWAKRADPTAASVCRAETMGRCKHR